MDSELATLRRETIKWTLSFFQQIFLVQTVYPLTGDWAVCTPGPPPREPEQSDSLPDLQSLLLKSA